MMNCSQIFSRVAIVVFLSGAAGCTSMEDRWATGQEFDDAALTARVKGALADAKDVDARAIKVNTRRGEVVLSGTVRSEQMIDRAELAAWNVDGVLMVRSDLEVARGAEASGMEAFGRR